MNEDGIVRKNNLPRAAKRTEDTTFDRIWKHYFTDVSIELTEKEEQIKERWDTAWKALGKWNNRERVWRMLVRMYGIHRATAYRDIRNAEMLFSDAFAQNKAAKRAITSAGIERALEKCEKEGNWKAYEKLLLRYTRLNGLDTDDDKFAEYLRKKKPATIVFVTDAAALKKQAEELMKDVEDIDHEDVTDDSNEQPYPPGEE